MSLSSAQRLIWAIENFAPISRDQVRPHELLNYFSFDTAPHRPGKTFSVLASLERSETGARLALAVAGPDVQRVNRRSVNLSYVLDRSGSMEQQGRMEYLKQGLLRSLAELKHGDILHLTLFDSTACQLVENFVVGRDSLPRLQELIAAISPQGSTNLSQGLSLGYQAADRAYVPSYTNRVVLITDAEANTGSTDPRLIAEVGRYYDTRRIRLSGIGVGHTFNDALLDELTERGRGAYVYLGDGAEVDAIFGSRFVSLIETVANDVHFQLRLPPSLGMQTFFGEEASADKSRVQAVHSFAGTDQLFLSDLTLPEGNLREDDELMLSIDYEDPESGTPRQEDFVLRVADIWGSSANLKKASFISTFARTVAALSDGTHPRNHPQDDPAHRWSSPNRRECDDRYEAARRTLGEGHADAELSKVDHLFRTFCARFPSAAGVEREPLPLRNNDFEPRDTWPGAQSLR